MRQTGAPWLAFTISQYVICMIWYRWKGFERSPE